MPFDFDFDKPLDNDIVSAFPANERAAREAVADSVDVEHNHTTGIHKFLVGTTSARDAITTWETGSLMYNTTVSQLQVQTGTPPTFSWVAAVSAFDYNAFVAAAASLTAPAKDDLLVLTDVSDTPDAAKKITLEDTLKVIDGLTEDTTPDPAADFLVSYDTSAATAKKIKLGRWAGAQVQFVAATPYTSTALLGNTPFDNTIPQVTEGTQILTLTITPRYSSSKIVLRFHGVAGSDQDEIVIAALFKDGASDALHATGIHARRTNSNPSASNAVLSFEYVDSPGDTSAHTYTVRAGGAGGAGRMNVVQQASGGAAFTLGGVMACTLTAVEIVA